MIADKGWVWLQVYFAAILTNSLFTATKMTELFQGFIDFLIGIKL